MGKNPVKGRSLVAEPIRDVSVVDEFVEIDILFLIYDAYK